jgi:hypothetical protein
MSDGVLALIGVVVGAVVTGGITAVSAWWGRRRAERAALRLIYADVVHALRILEQATEHDEWWPDLEPLPTDRWERYRDALADSSLSFADWATLDGVFSQLAHLQATCDRRAANHVQHAHDWLFAQAHMVEDAYRQLLEANRIVTGRAIGSRERRRSARQRFRAGGGRPSEEHHARQDEVERTIERMVEQGNAARAALRQTPAETAAALAADPAIMAAVRKQLGQEQP